MKSNYQPIGKYIREVNIRNRGLEVNQLMGLSIEKRFIPYIANTIGTDMSTYRIIKRNQFAYGPVTSRNGEKITIALFQDYDISMISQAYTVFEIIDTDKLLPEYLMMWFRRPEFDRYARFMSHGSVRELFGWEELCNTTLPVPHIDNQREIVQEYKTITDRIELNKKLCLKLEETAQAIYREWFVDFEFPNEDGKPYKSSGGEMIESELGQIPIGWRSVNISNIIAVNQFKKVNKIKGVEFGERLNFIVNKYNERKEELALQSEVLGDVTDRLVELFNDMKTELSSFKELGVTFEEKAFYDILKSIRDKYKFEYTEKKLIELAKDLKLEVDQKSKYTDWADRDDIKAELQVSVILILAKHGYPPVTQDEVYREIFEQAENFKKYKNE